MFDSSFSELDEIKSWIGISAGVFFLGTHDYPSNLNEFGRIACYGTH